MAEFVMAYGTEFGDAKVDDFFESSLDEQETILEQYERYTIARVFLKLGE